METQVNSQSTCHLHSLICIALDQCSKLDFASQWLKRSSEILPIKAMLARAAWRRPDGADTSDLFNLYIYNYIYIHINLLLFPSSFFKAILFVIDCGLDFCTSLSFANICTVHFVLILWSFGIWFSSASLNLSVYRFLKSKQCFLLISDIYIHIIYLFYFYFYFYSISNSISISILFYF
jgi:hypothetical protein